MNYHYERQNTKPVQLRARLTWKMRTEAFLFNPRNSKSAQISFPDIIRYGTSIVAVKNIVGEIVTSGEQLMRRNWPRHMEIYSAK